MDPIEIRRARPDEAAALTDLSMRSKRSNGYDDAFMQACRDELTVHPDRVTQGEYWVADAGGVRGWACLRAFADGGRGEVEAFFVDPYWKRRGIGRRLWEKLRERARALELTRLTLDADPAAIPFYEALGFEIVGTAPSGSIPGRMLPRMAIEIE